MPSPSEPGGRLAVVSLPIGDPQDVTLRALRVLREADAVLAEDTRVTAAFLREHGIVARLVSLHDHNEADRVEPALARLGAGERLALVSDAGTPLVNDPGFRLVRACVEAGVPVDVVPGPCAAVAALVGSGLPPDRFVFGGFLPREREPRRQALVELGALRATLVLYESPLRAADTLAAVAELWPERPVCVARNLTKVHEQWLRGTAAEARQELGDETRGEVVLLVGHADEPVDIDRAIQEFANRGLSGRGLRDAVAAATGCPKKEVYERILGGSPRAGVQQPEHGARTARAGGTPASASAPGGPYGPGAGAPTLLLASASPWRLALLREAGIPCDARPPGVDEGAIVGADPVATAILRARAKAEFVARLAPRNWVLGADQVAHLDGEAFGKPTSPDDHRRRLRQLRGRTHRLSTAICLVVDGKPNERVAHTDLTFRADLSDEELDAYVATGEGSACAGGYRAERLGAQLIERVDGDWSNVIGLPLPDLIGLLRGLGWRPRFA
jgi:16S rRNA (cytidine1402-2'-O)-methyltransferase